MRFYSDDDERSEWVWNRAQLFWISKNMAVLFWERRVWFCLVEQGRNEGPMFCYPTMNFVNQSVYDHDHIPTT